MKHAFTAGTGLLSLLAPAWVAAQSALGPWVDVPSVSQGALNVETTIRLPQPGVVWALFDQDMGMGVKMADIIRSSDNGASWQTSRSPIGYSTLGWMRDVWALDAQTAWAIANQPVSGGTLLMKTNTGPTGFSSLPAQVPVASSYVRFFSATTGLVLAEKANVAGALPLYRTSDGGASWQLVPGVPATQPEAVPTTCAVVGSHIFVFTTNFQGQPHLLHSADTGVTWSLTALPAATTQLTFRDALHGLAYSHQFAPYPNSSSYLGTTLYRTVDGGATWSLVQASLKLHPSTIAAVPGSPGTYLNVGGTYGNQNAGTAISYDDGQSWRELGGTEVLTRMEANPQGAVWASVSSTGMLRRLSSTALAAGSSRPTPLAAAYPNPATGTLHLPAAGTYRTVTVCDAAGRLCRTVLLGPAETPLELRELGAGTYVLRFEGDQAAPTQQRVVVP